MRERIRTWVRVLLEPRALDEDLADELALHAELEAAELERQGLSPAAARRRARIALGGEDRWREELREVSGLGRVRELWQDLRVAARSLVRHASFSVAAVLTLAIALGAGTVILAVVDGVLLRPLPYPSADRLVMVWQQDRVSETEREPASLPDYLDYRVRVRSFTALAGFAEYPVNAAEASGAERVQVAEASFDLLDVLGVQPAAGRMFTEAEVRSGTRVALLSDGYARLHFAGAVPIGRTVRFDGTEYTVIGVLPERLDFPSARTAAWLPLEGGGMADLRAMHWVHVIGRLRAGVERGDAQRELAGVMAQLEREYPESNAGRGAFVEPLDDALFGPVRPTLLVLSLAVILLLVGACANVGNLLLARGTARSQEVAVRRALGASTYRLLRQYLAEGLVLCGAASVLGIGIAQAGLTWIVPQLPANLPRSHDLQLDARVLAGVLCALVALASVFAVAGVLQARSTGLQDTLRADARRVAGGGRAQTLRRVLLVAQLALSTLLVIDAVLLVRSFRALGAVDPGFDTVSVLKVEYQLPATRYPVDLERWPALPATQRFTSELLRAVRELPGVHAAAIAAYAPTAAGNTNGFSIVGREQERLPEVRLRPVSDGYLETTGLQLVSGRGFTPRDGADAQTVLLVNESAARRYFPDQPAVGQRIGLWGSEREIVGVIADERMDGLAAETPPALYIPYAQAPFGNAVLLLRVAGGAGAQLPAVRQVFRSLDPELAVFGVETLASAVAAGIARTRLTALLLGGFAAIALLVALVGIYGVLSYSVAQRRRELAVRLALGCTRVRLVDLVLTEGLTFAALGGLLGLAGAAASSRLLAHLTFGVSPTDGWTYAGTFLLLTLTATLASVVPAWRAALTSPSLPLRE